MDYETARQITAYVRDHCRGGFPPDRTRQVSIIKAAGYERLRITSGKSRSTSFVSLEKCRDERIYSVSHRLYQTAVNTLDDIAEQLDDNRQMSHESGCGCIRYI